MVAGEFRETRGDGALAPLDDDVRWVGAQQGLVVDAREVAADGDGGVEDEVVAVAADDAALEAEVAEGDGEAGAEGDDAGARRSGGRGGGGALAGGEDERREEHEEARHGGVYARGRAPYLGDARLKETLTNVMVTAYDFQDRFAFFFRSSRARTNDEYDFSLDDEVLAQLGR